MDMHSITCVGDLGRVLDMGHAGVMVVGEQRRGEVHPVTFELLARGRQLADRLGAELSCVVIGSGLETGAREIIERGADVVYLVDDPALAWFLPGLYARALARLIQSEIPEIVIAAATTSGRTLMPLVAARLGTGLTADCTELDIDTKERLLLQTRPAIGGNVMATIKTPQARPQMATVRPKSARPLPRDAARVGRVVQVKLETKDCGAVGGGTIGCGAGSGRGQGLEVVLGSVRDATQEVNVQDAEVIVTGGKGLKNKDNFRMIEELASLLGAAVGATRDVVDLGWISYPHQIGLSGKTVAPRLYIAVGVSGSVQHLAGMQTAETIIAVNKDKDAQIFKVADFGIVGDLFEVVPEMIEKIRNRTAAGR